MPGLRRAPPIIFNEKVSAGLSRIVSANEPLTGPMGEQTLRALSRFRAICRALQVGKVVAIATAAVRAASDGAAFLAACREALGVDVALLSGEDEARMAARGLISGIPTASGLVGDLGGGSLELIGVDGATMGEGASLPIGTLALQARIGSDYRLGRRQVDGELDGIPWLGGLADQTIYAIGGTWRAIGRLHMAATDYPMRVIHQYEINQADALEFLRRLQVEPIETIPGAERLSEARRIAVPYGAVALERLVKRLKPPAVVFSAFGVREGVLYGEKSRDEQERDPLMAACLDLARMRSRSFDHVQEIGPWLDPLFQAAVPKETRAERRIRHAICVLSDIGWLSHPEYRGEHGVNTIENSNFAGVTHGERAMMALAIYYRNEGLGRDGQVERLATVMSPAQLQRARVIAAALRAVHMVSAAMPGILDHASVSADNQTMQLRMGPEIVAFDGERLRKRFTALARELDREFEVVFA